MKRIISVILAALLVFCATVASAVEIDYKSLSDEELQQILAAVVEEIEYRKTAPTEVPTEQPAEAPAADTQAQPQEESDAVTITTTDELIDWINNDVETTAADLRAKWDEIIKKTTSYDEYKANVGLIRDLYTEIDNATLKLCLRMRCYAFDYVVLELNSGKSNSEIYKNLSDLYDVIYDDARDDIYDNIYDDLLKDMYDDSYDGVLKKAYDNAPYEEWDDFRSEEYSLWDETRSSVYGNWDETFSDIYSFWDSFRSNIYNDETELACKTAIRFHKGLLKDIEKNGLTEKSITGISVNADNILGMTFEPTPVDNLDETVTADLETTLAELEKEWAELSAQTDTFENYLANADQVEEFFEKVVSTTEELCLRQQQYAIDYANVILQSDSQTKYRDLTYLYSSLYGGSRREIYRATYNGLLKDMYKYYYNGVLKKARKTTSYSEWSSARSDVYGWWSDARSDVYSVWSDTFSDIYSFWSDLRSEVYSKDMDKAQKEIDKFQKKVDRKKK